MESLLHPAVATALKEANIDHRVLACDDAFAEADATKQMTMMEIGGMTAIGVNGLPIYVDRQVMAQSVVIMGGGNRTSKVIINPQELTKLANVTLVDDLARIIE